MQNSCKETKEDNGIIVPSILLPISQVKITLSYRYIVVYPNNHYQCGFACDRVASQLNSTIFKYENVDINNIF